MAADERWAEFRTASGVYPAYADMWFGDTTTYPVGRGLTAPRMGWQCPGCHRCLSPAMRECPHCPEASGTQPVASVMGEWEDEK